MPDFLKGVTLEDLGAKAAAALARREVFLLESEHIASKPIPVETFVRSIHERIVTDKRLSFRSLVQASPTPSWQCWSSINDRWCAWSSPRHSVISTSAISKGPVPCSLRRTANDVQR